MSECGNGGHFEGQILLKSVRNQVPVITTAHLSFARSMKLGYKGLRIVSIQGFDAKFRFLKIFPRFIAIFRSSLHKT